MLSGSDASREYRYIAYVYYTGTDGPSLRLKSQFWGLGPTAPLREDMGDRRLNSGWNRLA